MTKVASSEDLREVDEREENLLNVMADFSENYLSDPEAMDGKLSSNGYVKDDGTTISDIVDKPREYLKRNPDHPHSAREIAEDIVDPTAERWVRTALNSFRNDLDDHFVSDSEQDKIEREVDREHAPEKPREEDYGLREILFSGKSFEDEKEVWEENRDYDLSLQLADASEENLREFYDGMTEEQQQEFVLDTIAQDIEDDLERSYHRDWIGKIERTEEDATDYRGHQRYIVMS